MLLQAALTELLLAKDFTPATRQRRQETLGAFVAWAKGEGVTQTQDVTRATIRRYVAWLRETPNTRYGGTLASETQHGRASNVRMFLRWCASEGFIDDKEVAHFPMPRMAHKVVNVFTPQHFARLMAATDACPLPTLRLRDKALLAVLLDTGLRAQEVCTLTLDAVHIAPGDSYLRVQGKGRKEREVGLGKQASLALHRYLTRARPKSDYPFAFLDRAGRPLTPNAIDRVLYRLRDVAGASHFAGVRVSAHTLRHSYACHYMAQGGDVYKLSRLLGHENIHTTERYLAAFQASDARKGASVLDCLV